MIGLSPNRKTPRLPAFWLLLVAGLAFGATGVYLLGRTWVGDLILQASDYLMLSETGPKLGMRNVGSDIVIVEFGENSAERLASKPTEETDRNVYKNLLDAGAKAIADQRQLAALLPEDFEKSTQPQLESISQIDNARGRLVRDVLVGSLVDGESFLKFSDFVCHDAITIRSPVNSQMHSRIAPIAVWDQHSISESMSLWLARRHANLPPTRFSQAKTKLEQSGVATLWKILFPVIADSLDGKTDIPTTAPALNGNYSLGSSNIAWQFFEPEWLHVAPAGYRIDYSLPIESFQKLDYGVVADGDFDRSLIQDKIVLIGLDIAFIPNDTRFGIPNARKQFGQTMVLAYATQTLIEDRSIRFLPQWVYFSAPIALAMAVAMIVGRAHAVWACFIPVGLFIAYFAVATILYRNCWLPDFALTPTLMICSAITAGGIRYGYEIRWRNHMTDLFGRYVPRAVVTDLIKKRALQGISVGGNRREITVMFADIRGFTKFTEGNEPEKVLARLNEFLQIMVDCTFEQDGTVDKFIGDAILVLFNAPTEQPDHVERAVKTAWSIQERLAALSRSDESGDLQIGIGIHTGEAIVGTVGTPERMEYTAIGSTVNMASRLCDQADGGSVIVSEQVVATIGKEFQWIQNKPITVKGIDRPITTSTLKHANPPAR